MILNKFIRGKVIILILAFIVALTFVSIAIARTMYAVPAAEKNCDVAVMKIAAAGSGITYSDIGSAVDFEKKRIWDSIAGKEQYYSVINVKQFGAAGDGVTDDRAAIQAALDYIVNNQGGSGTLYFPVGIYKTGAGLSVSGLAEAMITADKGAKIRTEFDNLDCLVIENSYDVIIQGLELDGNQPEQIKWGHQGLTIVNSKRMAVRDCYIHDFADSGLISSSDRFSANPPTGVTQEDIIVSNCVFERCTQTSTTSGGSKNAVYTNNVFKNFRLGVKFASRIDGAGNLIFANNIIEDFDAFPSTFNIGANPQAALEISSYKNVLIANNTIRNINYSGPGTKCNDGFRYYPNYGYASERNVGDVKIYGNDFSDIDGRSICIDCSVDIDFALTNILIENNSFHEIGGSCVSFEGKHYQDCSVKNNVFTDFKSYGINIISSSFTRGEISQNSFKKDDMVDDFDADVILIDSPADGLTISGNDIKCLKTSSGNGIHVRNLINAVIKNNIVQNSGSWGIYLYNSENCDVIDNKLENNSREWVRVRKKS